MNLSLPDYEQALSSGDLGVIDDCIEVSILLNDIVEEDAQRLKCLARRNPLELRSSLQDLGLI